MSYSADILKAFAVWPEIKIIANHFKNDIRFEPGKVIVGDGKPKLGFHLLFSGYIVSRVWENGLLELEPIGHPCTINGMPLLVKGKEGYFDAILLRENNSLLAYAGFLDKFEAHRALGTPPLAQAKPVEMYLGELSALPCCGERLPLLLASKLAEILGKDTPTLAIGNVAGEDLDILIASEPSDNLIVGVEISNPDLLNVVEELLSHYNIPYSIGFGYGPHSVAIKVPFIAVSYFHAFSRKLMEKLVMFLLSLLSEKFNWC